MHRRLPYYFVFRCVLLMLNHVCVLSFPQTFPEFGPGPVRFRLSSLPASGSFRLPPVQTPTSSHPGHHPQSHHRQRQPASGYRVFFFVVYRGGEKGEGS